MQPATVWSAVCRRRECSLQPYIVQHKPAHVARGAHAVRVDRRVQSAGHAQAVAQSAAHLLKASREREQHCAQLLALRLEVLAQLDVGLARQRLWNGGLLLRCGQPHAVARDGAVRHGRGGVQRKADGRDATHGSDKAAPSLGRVPICPDKFGEVFTGAYSTGMGPLLTSSYKAPGNKGTAPLPTTGPAA